MHRAVRDIAVVLLALLVVAGAKAASIRGTDGLIWPPKQLEMSVSSDHSKEISKASFTQGRRTWPVKHISSFPGHLSLADFAGCDTAFFIFLRTRPRLFSSSLYFSSLCNKAPPVA